MSCTPSSGASCGPSAPVGAQRVHAVVRLSRRARRMRLVAHPGKGLELVAPVGTAQGAMQAFLEQHAAWAARTLRRLGAPLDAREGLVPRLPGRVELPALGEVWRLVRRPAAGLPAATLRLALGPLLDGGEREANLLHAPGTAPAPADVGRLLRHVLRLRAQEALPGWVARLAGETGLPAPPRIRIGMQRTRWGSLSAGGTLSLSGRLLLLPPELVRHVILHELCHEGHLHHRASFHRRVLRYDPQAAEHHQALCRAGMRLPVWSSG